VCFLPQMFIFRQLAEYLAHGFPLGQEPGCIVADAGIHREGEGAGLRNCTMFQIGEVPGPYPSLAPSRWRSPCHGHHLRWQKRFVPALHPARDSVRSGFQHQALRGKKTALDGGARGCGSYLGSVRRSRAQPVGTGVTSRLCCSAAFRATKSFRFLRSLRSFRVRPVSVPPVSPASPPGGASLPIRLP